MRWGFVMRIAALWQSHVLQLLAQQSKVLLQAGDLFLLAEDREIQRFQQVFHLREFDFDFGQSGVHRYFHIDMAARDCHSNQSDLLLARLTRYAF